MSKARTINRQAVAHAHAGTPKSRLFYAHELKSSELYDPKAPKVLDKKHYRIVPFRGEKIPIPVTHEAVAEFRELERLHGLVETFSILHKRLCTSSPVSVPAVPATLNP